MSGQDNRFGFGEFWDGQKAGRVRYWQYGQAEKSPDLAISDLSRFLSHAGKMAGNLSISLDVRESEIWK